MYAVLRAVEEVACPALHEVAAGALARIGKQMPGGDIQV
jgi:hypothetical protein